MVIEKHMLATAVDRCFHLGVELSHLLKVLDTIYYGINSGHNDYDDSEQSCIHVMKEYLQMLYDNDVVPLLEVMKTLDSVDENTDN